MADTVMATVQDKQDVVVDIKGLNFSYNGVPILHDINLSVKRGSRTLLLGVNGAGKSTILRVLAGKNMVHEGSVMVNGIPCFYGNPEGVTHLDSEWLANPMLRRDVVVEKMIEAVGGNKFPERRAELEELLQVNPQWHMHQVSDGQRRRVQILMGLLSPWSILLLDEVTVDLDILCRQELLEYLQRETETRGATVVYASHILDGLAEWVTDIVHVEQGRLVTVSPVDELPDLQDPTALMARTGKSVLRSSPLLVLANEWLRKEHRRKKSERLAPPKEKPVTRLDRLRDDPAMISIHADKYYDYWSNRE